MKKKTKAILLVILILFILGIVFSSKIKGWFARDLNDTPPAASLFQSQTALQVNGVVLKYDTLIDIFRTKGLLIPDEEVDLSFEIPGKITRIYFQEGAPVQKGELLATVNDELLQAELKKLKAQMPLAEDRLARQEALYKKDAVSKESYESVSTELEKLEADIELVQARINQTELRAPFDGIIGLRQVSEGAFASSTTIISKLTKITPLKIEFSVNEKQARDIKPGKSLSFTVENDRTIYQATVYAVESKLDEKTLSLKARAIYPNLQGRLKPGQSASIEIQLNKIVNTIVIPSVSSIAEMGRSIAYIYKNGKAQQVVIEKGMRTASSVQVLSGLNVGDTLLVTGVMQLRNDLPVYLQHLTE